MPATEGRRWRPHPRPRPQDTTTDRVTLLGEHIEPDRQHFRFRAESPAEGPVELHFETDGPHRDIAVIQVDIAPENRA